MNDLNQQNQPNEGSEKELSALVGELDSMRGKKDKPALDQKARMELIYAQYDTKESIMDAIAALEAMKKELAEKKEETAEVDVDSLNVQIAAIEKAMEPLKEAMVSLKALSDTNPAVVSLSDQLHQLEIQRNGLAETLKKYEEFGDPAQRIAAIDRAIEDFKAVVKYFEKMAERIADVDSRYAELPGEMGMSLPVNPEERRKVLAMQKKVARKMRGTLRSLEVIEEPGRGELAEDETIRERTEAFLGKEEVKEGEILSMKPDKREEIMALWYAGLEPDAANLRKVRAFFKSPDYLRVRTQVANRLKEIELATRHFQPRGFDFSSQIEAMKNKLSRLFKRSDLATESMYVDLENEINEHCHILRTSSNVYLEYNNMKEGGIDYYIGSLMRKFDEETCRVLAMARVEKLRKYNGRSLDNAGELQVYNEKMFVAEVFPFLAEQLGSGKIGLEVLNKLNSRLPGFITFNEQDGPAMTEDIPRTGGRDAINRLAVQRYRKAKKERGEREAEQLEKSREERRKQELVAEQQRSVNQEVMDTEMRIQELIIPLFEKLDLHDKLGKKIDAYGRVMEERNRLIAKANNFVDELSAMGVKLPKPEEYETEKSIEYYDLVIRNAEERADSFWGRKEKSDINSTVTVFKSLRRELVSKNQEVEQGKDEYERNSQLILEMRVELIRQIKEVQELIQKRRAIQPVGGMRIRNVDDMTLNYRTQSMGYTHKLKETELSLERTLLWLEQHLKRV